MSRTAVRGSAARSVRAACGARVAPGALAAPRATAVRRTRAALAARILAARILAARATRPALAALAALALVACGSSESAPPAPGASELASSAPARWVAARAPDGTALLEAPAKVVAAPEGRAAVAPPLRARVLAVRAQVGATVAAGAPLVDLALPEAAAAAAEYLAAVDQIAAHEQRAKHLESLRQEGLARTGDVAAIELELARLRGARELAATTLRAAGLSLADARALAASGGRVPLRAPIAGTVISVAAVVGASAPPEVALVE
ncbi:MAG: efflux RND transporter periplasmic adaptor subunit, partial [Kofleriaceae bacterium]